MKIVINACYGGFGVSNEALLELIKRDSKIVEKIPINKYYGSNIKDYPWEDRMRNGEREYIPYKEGFYSHPFLTSLKKDGIIYSYDKHNGRDDKDLIEVVETLGKEANGNLSDLKVVEIPDGIDWEIDEYDGMESIHEKHRMWD
jgi:hypothetical protein